MIGEAREGEAEIRETIEVDQEERRHLVSAGELDDAALGATADGSRHVQAGGLLGAGREDERLERWQLEICFVDGALELVDTRGRELCPGQCGPNLVGVGRREVAADDEEVALDRLEKRVEELLGAAARTRPRTEFNSSTSP